MLGWDPLLRNTYLHTGATNVLDYRNRPPSRSISGPAGQEKNLYPAPGEITKIGGHAYLQYYLLHAPSSGMRL